MGTKRTPALVTRAKRLRAEHRSDAEVAQILTKEAAVKGGKPISKSTIGVWLGAKKSASKPPKASPPAPAEPIAPTPPLEPFDGAEMSPADFSSWLTMQLRQAQASADACRATDDQQGAGRAMRLAAQLAALLQKQHARTADEGGVIRVQMSDIAVAAERARAKLEDLVDRIRADRAALPRCKACGGPIGSVESDPAAASPMRVLLERTATLPLSKGTVSP